MKKLIFTGVVTAAFACATAATAQAPVDWNGLYLGGYAGYAWSGTQGTDIGDPGGLSWRNLGERFPNKAHGFTGGVQAGFNVQSGAFVWGLESDLGYLGLKGTGQWNPYPDFMDTSASFAATFRGRAGFTSGNALVYFTGGGILGDLNNRIRLNNGQWQTFATNAQWGWTAGAGVKWALDRQWSLKTEYLYYSFGKETVFTDNCGAGNCYFSTETAGSLVRVGLNYRFGRP